MIEESKLLLIDSIRKIIRAIFISVSMVSVTWFCSGILSIDALGFVIPSKVHQVAQGYNMFIRDIVADVGMFLESFSKIRNDNVLLQGECSNLRDQIKLMTEEHSKVTVALRSEIDAIKQINENLNMELNRLKVDLAVANKNIESQSFYRIGLTLLPTFVNLLTRYYFSVNDGNASSDLFNGEDRVKIQEILTLARSLSNRNRSRPDTSGNNQLAFDISQAQSSS